MVQFILEHCYYHVFYAFHLSIYFQNTRTLQSYCILFSSWPHAQNNKVFKVNKVSVWFSWTVYLLVYVQLVLGGWISLVNSIQCKRFMFSPRPHLKIQKQASCFWTLKYGLSNIKCHAAKWHSAQTQRSLSSPPHLLFRGLTAPG